MAIRKVELRPDGTVIVEHGEPGCLRCRSKAQGMGIRKLLRESRSPWARSGLWALFVISAGWELLSNAHTAFWILGWFGVGEAKIAALLVQAAAWRPLVYIVLTGATIFLGIGYLAPILKRPKPAFTSFTMKPTVTVRQVQPPSPQEETVSVAPPSATANTTSDELLAFILEVQRWLELRSINAPNARKDYPQDSPLQAMLSLSGSRTSQYGYETVAEYKHTFQPKAITIYNSLITNAPARTKDLDDLVLNGPQRASDIERICGYLYYLRYGYRMTPGLPSLFPRLSFDTKFVYRLHQHAEVVAENPAQDFVDLSNVRLGTNAASELRLGIPLRAVPSRMGSTGERARADGLPKMQESLLEYASPKKHVGAS